MRQHLKLVIVLLLMATGGGWSSQARSGLVSDSQGDEEIRRQIIAREKASFAAWQRRDKAFYADYWADDFTEFLPQNPYLDTKANILPKFEKLSERWKIDDFQMYNPHVQLYGNVAILTYNESISGKYDGQPSSYTGKVTMVYVKQGNTWRGVHYHESTNAGAK